MTHPTIHMGSKGSEVTLAQKALKDRGYDPGPIDGIFGPRPAKRFFSTRRIALPIRRRQPCCRRHTMRHLICPYMLMA